MAIDEDDDSEWKNWKGERESMHQRSRISCHRHNTAFPGAVRTSAYKFDGYGQFTTTDWDDLRNVRDDLGEGFSWFHLELPRSENQRSTLLAAQYLIDLLCPPLTLQEILALASNGPFFGSIEGALVFRVNSAGSTMSKFTHKIAALVTDDRVISVSLGKVPGLAFSSTYGTESLLNQVPRLDDSDSFETTSSPFSAPGEPLLSSRGGVGDGEQGVVIQEHLLEFMLTMNHPEHAIDNPVPHSVSNLLVHIIGAHVDQLQGIVIKLEMDLDDVESELDTGTGTAKKEMLDTRRFPKIYLDLQRLLQKIAHGEAVFPRMKDRCTTGNNLGCSSPEDAEQLDVLVGRLRKLKENVVFISSRITAIQAGLDAWQAEQISRKLYYLSFLSMIFLPLSVVTGIFGMNVGGVPWTKQEELGGEHGESSDIKHGFRNVMIICAQLVFVMLLACFGASPLYAYLSTRRKLNQAAGKHSKKSIRIKRRNRDHHTSYLPLHSEQ